MGSKSSNVIVVIKLHKCYLHRLYNLSMSLIPNKYVNDAVDIKPADDGI